MIIYFCGVQGLLTSQCCNFQFLSLLSSNRKCTFCSRHWCIKCFARSQSTLIKTIFRSKSFRCKEKIMLETIIFYLSQQLGCRIFQNRIFHTQIKRQNSTYIFFQGESTFGRNHQFLTLKVQFELYIFLINACCIMVLEVSHKNKT